VRVCEQDALSTRDDHLLVRQLPLRLRRLIVPMHRDDWCSHTQLIQHPQFPDIPRVQQQINPT